MESAKFYLKAKLIDIEARVSWIVVINKDDCQRIGIRPGTGLLIHLKGQRVGVYVDETDSLVSPGEIGIFKDLVKRFGIVEKEPLEFSIIYKPVSLNAIQKKLFGKHLSYKEIYSIVADIVSHKLNDVAVAFFIASSFFENISEKELFYLTKAMAETGKQLSFSGIVADKHSVGGLCGNETTPILVPIVASCGITIPKTCSRAITSASGTADTFETAAPVVFQTEELKKIVEKTNACITWGARDIVPSDARIIEVASQLSIESFSKALSSIVAKKVAMGVRYLVIDIPVQKTAKIKSIREAKRLKKMFLRLTGKFGIKTLVSINKAKGPIGRGIGAGLQLRDDLKVLFQEKDRPLDLERRAVELAGYILELTGRAKRGKGKVLAERKLLSGEALCKFREIVKAQGGSADIKIASISLSPVSFEVKSKKKGKVREINNRHLAEICRILGAPFIKGAGIYLNKKVGESVRDGETLSTFYAPTRFRLDLALKALAKSPIFKVS